MFFKSKKSENKIEPPIVSRNVKKVTADYFYNPKDKKKIKTDNAYVIIVFVSFFIIRYLFYDSLWFHIGTPTLTSSHSHSVRREGQISTQMTNNNNNNNNNNNMNNSVISNHHSEEEFVTDNNGYIPNSVTTEGTNKYVNRFPLLPLKHFRTTQGQFLKLSSIGIGTYIGEPNAKIDGLVETAIIESVSKGGINVIDTAINYRGQKAERCVGRAMKKLVNEMGFHRDEIFISTKAGFMPQDADEHLNQKKMIMKWEKEYNLDPSQVMDHKHCIHPSCLKASLMQSLENMKLKKIDLLYLHNAAEKQLTNGKPVEEFYHQLKESFVYLEQARAQGYLLYYGMATWQNFRTFPEDGMYTSLQRIVHIAEEVGGKEHGFKYIQLPLNAGLSEAVTGLWQLVDGYQEKMSFLDAAQLLGITVMSSRSINAGTKNTKNLAGFEVCPMDFASDAAKMLQITRSLPGMTTALVGMKTGPHLKENLEVPLVEPITPDLMKKCLDMHLQYLKTNGGHHK